MLHFPRQEADIDGVFIWDWPTRLRSNPSYMEPFAGPGISGEQRDINKTGYENNNTRCLTACLRVLCCYRTMIKTLRPSTTGWQTCWPCSVREQALYALAIAGWHMTMAQTGGACMSNASPDGSTGALALIVQRCCACVTSFGGPAWPTPAPANVHEKEGPL
eukprot:418692-Pelagomonas_calceolata.AAC.1